MDSLLEGTARLLWQALKWLVIDAFIDVVLHGLGYASIKLLTLGKHPTAKQHNEMLCISIGAAVLAAVIAVLLALTTAG